MIRFYFLFFFLKYIISKKQISDSELEKIYKNITNGFNETINISKKLNYRNYFLYFDNFSFFKLTEKEKPKFSDNTIDIKNLNFTFSTNISLTIFENSIKSFPMNNISIEIIYDNIKIIVQDNKIITNFNISTIFISNSFDIMCSKYFINFQNEINNKTGIFPSLLNTSIYDRINSTLNKI